MNQTFTEKFQSQQVLLVVAPDANSIQAQMQLLEWDATEKKWQVVIQAHPVTLGRTGLAWGKGLQPADWNIAPLKKEGDGKAPQGIFRISSLFGYKAENELDFEPKLPYIQATSNLFCVDDVNSAYYNQIVTDQNKDWNSAEEMRRQDQQYELGAVIDYNTPEVAKGSGSCVFLHVWRAADKPTAGCTAMERNNIVELFSRLDKSKNPTLVQFTQANADKYLKELGLR